MLEEQAGVMSRCQLLAAGVTDEVIAARVRAGQWRRLYQGVYATFSGPVPRPARLWAALLYAGDGAMLSHRSAAEVIGLVDRAHGPGRGGVDSAIHVTIPADRRVRRARGLVVHRSRRAAEIAHPARTPAQTRVEETVLDLTQAAATLDEAVEWLARACGRRLTTPTRLSQALRTRRGVRWRRELAAAIEDVRAGCHSLLEFRYLRNVERRHGLPRGTRQRSRKRPGGKWYDDVTYVEYATMVELDGRAAHPDEDRWREMDRDNAGVAAGLNVLRYGTAQVTDRACEIAAQVAAVLTRNGWPGPPRPCGPHCSVRDARVETSPSVCR